MTAALVLCQNVNLSGKLVVALNRTWLAQTLSSFDFSSLNATQQSADVIASLSEVQRLTEHLQALSLIHISQNPHQLILTGVAHF